MSLRPGETIVVPGTTHNPTTGAKQDATAVSGKLFINSVDSGETVTVVNVSTGLYKLTTTLPGSAVIGDQVHILLEATVATVAGHGVVFADHIDALHLIRMAMAPKKITANKATGTTKVFDTDGTTKLFETKVQAGASDDEVDLVDVP